MADAAVAITAGAGTSIDTYQITGGDHQQVIRKAAATAVTTDTWTVATTAATSRIAADASRLMVTMVNNSSGRVYLRFDSTGPTAAVCHWMLEPGDRYEVPEPLCNLAISVLGQFANGTLVTCLATEA